MTKEKSILDKAKAMGKTKFYALVSGGKDSISAAIITDRLVGLTGVIFVDTTIGLQETKDFVIRTCKEHSWKLKILKPKTTYEDMVLKYGFPKPSHHRMSFIYLKWQPIYYWIKDLPDREQIALISGVRKRESKRRGRTTEEIKIDATCKYMVWVAPIMYWSTSRVWEFVRKENIEVSPSYKKIHLSGDCLCGAYSKTGEAEIINAFYPEMAAKIRALEKKCKKRKYCTWGNQSSMKGVKDQMPLENYMCADCEVI